MSRAVNDSDRRLVRLIVVKTFVQIVVVWTLTLVVAPLLIVRVESWLGLDARSMKSLGLEFASVAVFAAASVLGLWSAWTMAVVGRGTPLPLDPAVRLVIAGPYRWVRNPMAIGGLAQGTAVALGLASPGMLIFVLCGFLVWNYAVRPWEERDLQRRFGEPFDRYRSEVDCWMPRRTPVVASQHPPIGEGKAAD